MDGSEMKRSVAERKKMQLEGLEPPTTVVSITTVSSHTLTDVASVRVVAVGELRTRVLCRVQAFVNI